VAQSDIFKYVLTTISENYEKSLDKNSEIVEQFIENSKKCQIKFDVSDIYQTSNDKTGQRIVIDNQRYEVPTQYAMIIKISFDGACLDVLSTIGKTAAFFKDNSVYDLKEYDWHGNTTHKFFLEPVIRQSKKDSICDKLYLEYKVEVQINSTKPESFTRVEKRDIRNNFIN